MTSKFEIDIVNQVSYLLSMKHTSQNSSIHSCDTIKITYSVEANRRDVHQCWNESVGSILYSNLYIVPLRP